MKQFQNAKTSIPYLIIGIFIFFLLVYRSLICFSFRPELSNGESNNIWKAINVANGKSMYTNPEDLPLEIFQYTPVSQLPIVGIAKLLDNNSAEYVHYVTSFGRLYELTCNLILAYIIFYISSKLLQKNKLVSLLTSTLILALFTNPAFTVRPDATLLVLISLVVVGLYKMEIDSSYKWTFITCMLITLSFYTKQDGLLISIPVGIRLLLLKKMKKFITLALGTIVLLILTLIILPFIFGPNFYTCVFNGLNNTSSLTQVITVFDRAFGFYGFHIITGLVIASSTLINRKNSKMSSIAILSVFYFITAIATSSKSGSWVNYYTPFIIFSSILILDFFSNIKHKIIQLNTYFSISLVVLISTLFLLKQIYVYTSPFVFHSETKVDYYRKYHKIKSIKQQYNIKKEDKILTINQLDRNFLAGNSIMINTEYYGYASFNYAKFRALKNKNIDYIIYNGQDKPTLMYLLQFFNVSTENYSETFSAGFHVLKLNKQVI